MHALDLLAEVGLDAAPLAGVEALPVTTDLGSLGIVLALAEAHLSDHPELARGATDGALESVHAACVHACLVADAEADEKGPS